jgi:hypothetical protein
VAVCRYENGGRHVGRDSCHYLGPASGSIRGAIKLHNERPAVYTMPDIREGY